MVHIWTSPSDDLSSQEWQFIMCLRTIAVIAKSTHIGDADRIERVARPEAGVELRQ